MNESMTPRTDALLRVGTFRIGVTREELRLFDHARQLERDLTAALARADKAEAELERVSKDAERWFKVWELDLVLHRLERGWWCTRISMDHDTIEYPPRATREEAIDAAIEQEKKNA